LTQINLCYGYYRGIFKNPLFLNYFLIFEKGDGHDSLKKAVNDFVPIANRA